VKVRRVAGMIGQVLYLEAEAAGVRSTEIGCYFDELVHEVLGLSDNQFQSLYQFTVGVTAGISAPSDTPLSRQQIDNDRHHRRVCGSREYIDNAATQNGKVTSKLVKQIVRKAG
jgi:hypothetical protein